MAVGMGAQKTGLSQKPAADARGTSSCSIRASREASTARPVMTPNLGILFFRIFGLDGGHDAWVLRGQYGRVVSARAHDLMMTGKGLNGSTAAPAE